FSPNDELLLTHSEESGDASVYRLLDLSEAALECKHRDSIRGAMFCQDNSRLLTWGSDGAAKLWDIRHPDPLETFVHADVVKGAAFNTDESRLLTWSGENMLSVWDVTRPEPLIIIRHPIYEARFVLNSTRILTRNYDDSTVTLWRCDDPQWTMG